MIIEIESAWRETNIACQDCGGMTYTDGAHRPICGDESCLRELSDAEIWQALITMLNVADAEQE